MAKLSGINYEDLSNTILTFPLKNISKLSTKSKNFCVIVGGIPQVKRLKASSVPSVFSWTKQATVASNARSARYQNRLSRTTVESSQIVSEVVSHLPSSK